MEDLSLHILDIVENSLRAGAKDVEIIVKEDQEADSLEIEIIDDGPGIDAPMLEKVLDPFFTTKSVRKVGLGLSLFREAARAAGGELIIESEPGKGTRVNVSMQHSHVDRQPLGDPVRTLRTLIVSHPEVRFRFCHRKNGDEDRFDSGQHKGDVSVRPRKWSKNGNRNQRIKPLTKTKD